jgi:hypothetical protein
LCDEFDEFLWDNGRSMVMMGKTNSCSFWVIGVNEEIVSFSLILWVGV